MLTILFVLILGILGAPERAEACFVNIGQCGLSTSNETSSSSSTLERIELNPNRQDGQVTVFCRIRSSGPDGTTEFTQSSLSKIQCPGLPDIPRELTTIDKPARQCGSIIHVDRQTLGEAVAVPGTPFALYYFSNRVPGYKAAFTPDIPLFDETTPSGVTGVDVTIEVAGRVFTRSYPVMPNLSHDFEWDGRDQNGNLVLSSAPAVVTLHYAYTSDASFLPQYPEFSVPFSFPFSITLGNAPAVGPESAGLGGWTLSIHHRFDPVRKTVYLGNGEEYIALPSTPNLATIEVGSPNGDEIYVFDSRGRHRSTKRALTGVVVYRFHYSSSSDVLTSVSDAFQNTTVFERNGTRLTAIVSPYGQRTQIELDANDYISAVQSPSGERFEMTYDGAPGLLRTFKKPAGQVSTFAYDGKGRLIRDEGAGGSSWDLLRTLASFGAFGIEMTSAEGLRTEYNIVRGKTEIGSDLIPITQRTEIYPSGATSSMSHIPLSSMQTTSKASMSSVLFFTPDPRFGNAASYISSQTVLTPAGRQQVTQISKSVTLNPSNDPYDVLGTRTDVSVNSLTTSVQFDGLLKKYTITSPAGRQASVDIDAQERPVRSQSANFTPVTYQYDARGRLAATQQGQRVTSFSYNDQGFLQRVTNGLNQTTEYTYNASGRVLTQKLPDQRVIQFTYDANGNLTSIVPSGRTAHGFVYNAFDLISSYLPPELGGGPLATTYEYNRDKRVTRIDRPDGQSLIFNYHPTKGLLDSITTPSGSYQYLYNLSELPTEITSPQNVRTQFRFDGDLLIEETNSGAGRGGIRYGYDDFFRLSSLTIDVGASPIEFAYDPEGLLTQAGHETLVHDPTQGVLKSTALDGVTEQFEYSEFAETAQHIAARGTTALYQATYVRNPLGQITSRTEAIGSGAVRTYGYIYDSAGRLLSVSVNGTLAATYVYDSNNNRISVDRAGSISSGTYDAQDRLLTYSVPAVVAATPAPSPTPSSRNNVLPVLQRVIAKLTRVAPKAAQVLTQVVNQIFDPSAPTIVTWNYTHNANGDLAAKTNVATGERTSYSYDVFGNLSSVMLADGTAITYLSDGRSRRVAKIVNGTIVRRYLFQGQLQLAGELDADGQVLSQFVYGRNANAPDYMVKDGVRYKFVTDHLGSPRLIVNTSTGAITQQMEFDEFGRVVQDTNPGFQPFGFAGGVVDSDTKLTLFGARSYDPEVGRWLSKDPIGFAGGDTNLYGYVMSDPVNFIDPSGLKLGWVSSALQGNLNQIENSGPAGRALLSQIRSLPNYIRINFDPNLPIGNSSFNAANGEVMIGGAGEACAANSDGSPFSISRTRALTHELGHAAIGGGTEFEAIRTENTINTPIDSCVRSSLSGIPCR